VSVEVQVRQGRWADSAKLLAAARAAEAVDGVDQAACFMATAANVADAQARGLLSGQSTDAGPDDLVLAVQGSAAGDGLAAAAAVLDAGPAGATSGQLGAIAAARSFADLEADVALISVPGDYAALDAHAALSAGMDVMLFSDGVSLDDEIVLKQRAHRLGRVVMGPGCGTAMIDGVGLAFANVVRRGGVGVVAAAGTGAQEVMVQLDRHGAGVSTCYGTGGRDLYAQVGAITMLDCIERLRDDPDTAVILCVSKPPAPEVAARVVDAIAASGKPGAACFVGLDTDDDPRGVRICATLDEAAHAAATLAGIDVPRAAFDPGRPTVRGVVRGLFSGGTLCSEAAAILAAELGQVVTNAPAGGATKLDGEPPADVHACLDLGEEEYTRGRPHPMIDPLARAELLAEVGAQPGVGVVLLDVVLGYGSHPDPAGALAPVLAPLRDLRADLLFVASVCGTETDPQVASRQVATLTAAGVQVAPSNAAAARLAASLVIRD
jgi:FdrA protein